MKIPDSLRLDYHPTARNRASASVLIPASQLILSAEPLSTSLLVEEKGRRCDACHCLATTSAPLLKCSRCAAYWYCGVQCQSRQWKAHHRKICKVYNSYSSSPSFQALSHAERVDALLLSQLIAEVFPDDDYTLPPKDMPPLMSTLLDLMPRQGDLTPPTPPVCTFGKANVPRDLIDKFFSRFGNNNFLLHSHLTAYAHGIFPLASRLFNHSCHPNAVTRYPITPGEPVRMEVVALRDILEGEEITIPYADPALPFDTRQTALQINYGFICTCVLCTFEKDIGPLPPLPKDSSDLSVMEASLRTYALPGIDSTPVAEAASHSIFAMPTSLYPLLNQSYLPELSEKFSEASHEGQYDVALPAGRTLLALYLVLYPPNFPQIGMHALELAKTSWNALVTRSAVEGSSTQEHGSGSVEKDARSYLAVAHGILENFGPEGDDGGPMEEIKVLEGLLNEPGHI